MNFKQNKQFELKDQSLGEWLSLMDYARYRGKSVSTIRRYIKNQQVVSKLINGKYFIFVSCDSILKFRPKSDQSTEVSKLNVQIQTLKTRIKELEEEKAELKMLVEAYEGKYDRKKVMPPSLPKLL